MTKHYKKTIQKEYSPEKPSVQQLVEHNKHVITGYLSGSNIKRLNNLNWLRHEIAYNEPRTLFYKPLSEQAAYFDYSCTKGLGDAYDYITDKEHSELNKSMICDVHYLIAHETNIQAGVFRTSPKILEITVNGSRIHTPDPSEIPSLLENTIYKWETSSKPDPLRAFDLHYDLILVHPFDDYNKRTSRMIMNWALVQCGYRPIVFNRKSDKQNYRKALASMANGDSKSYYKYMYGCMKYSQDQIISQLKNSNIR